MARASGKSLAAPCEFCVAAWGKAAARYTCSGHTGSAHAIAAELATVIHRETPSVERTGWFMQDGDAIAECLGQPESVEVRVLPDDRDRARFEVNGRVFAYDVNAEGFNVLRPAEDFEESEV